MKLSNLVKCWALNIALLALASCSAASTQIVNASDYKNWPYTSVDKITLECEKIQFGPALRPIATANIDGKIYGLNGAATGAADHTDVWDSISDDPSAFRERDLDAFLKALKFQQKILDQALVLCN